MEVNDANEQAIVDWVNTFSLSHQPHVCMPCTALRQLSDGTIIAEILREM
jgi:hypothetical protein